MEKMKVMTVVGTRPEIIKMSAIIKKCDQYFDHVLVHTGQNYDYQLNEIFFKELGLRAPDYYLGVVGENLGQTMGNVIAKSYELMAQVKPDAVIVLGDTNSCLSVVSAKRLKIPVFHMEAGNRCKDENLPEEVIRRIVDVTSDVNLCYSEHARRYILDSGVKPEYTFVVGSPMAEVLSGCKEQILSSDVVGFIVNVFLSVRGKKDIFPLFQTKTGVNIARLDFRKIVVQNFRHRRARYVRSFLGQTAIR
jgi:UDP-N-acetylglucosamine 2-epimerase (non-hydrolysing)